MLPNAPVMPNGATASDGLGDGASVIQGFGGMESHGSHLSHLTVVPGQLSVSLPTRTLTASVPDIQWSLGINMSLSYGVQENTRLMMNIVPLRVDATSPHVSRVFYRVEPDNAVATSVTFTTPASTGTGTQALSNVTGEFSFTFDEAQLPTGSSDFVLDWTPTNPYTPLDSTSVKVGATRASMVASGSSSLGAWVLAGDSAPTPTGTPNGGLVRISMTPYELHEFYDKFSYSIPVVAESQTIYAADNSVSIGTPELLALPSTIAGWGETHHYSYQSADYGSSSMTNATGATLPAQSGHFRSKDGVAGFFFAPGHDLIGIAHCDSLMFTSEDYQGLVLPVFLDAVVSDTQTIVVPIE